MNSAAIRCSNGPFWRSYAQARSSALLSLMNWAPSERRGTQVSRPPEGHYPRQLRLSNGATSRGALSRRGVARLFTVLVAVCYGAQSSLEPARQLCAKAGSLVKGAGLKALPYGSADSAAGNAIAGSPAQWKFDRVRDAQRPHSSGADIRSDARQPVLRPRCLPLHKCCRLA